MSSGMMEMRWLRAADRILELDVVGNFLEALRNATVRIQRVGEKHEGLATQRACGGHGVRRIGEQNRMRFLGNEASRAMAAEIDDLNVMFTAGCLNGGNIFVSPAPEFDMSKTGGGDAWNFLLCQELGVQGIKANGGCHKFSWSLQWSDSRRP